jgi:RsiW-degrading membrane proteinase PrsW (M82 family)
MMILVSILSAVLPSLVLLWYFYSRHVNPGPGRVLLTTFVLGILIVAPVAALELTAFSDFGFITDPFLLGLTKAFWGAAIPEELLKFVVVLFYCFRHQAFGEPIDGMVYGAVASLGFATMENVLYVTHGGVFLALTRAVTAVPCHAFLGAIMGYFVGQARFDSRSRGRLFATGLGLAILLHGLYDFSLLTLRALNVSGRPLPLMQVLAVSALSGLFIAVLLIEGFVTVRLLHRLRARQLYVKDRLDKIVKDQL